MAKRGKGRQAVASAEAWERAAYEAIRSGGLAAVSIERLARELGVTKGSFYWHYADRAALIEAALRRWETAVVSAMETLRPIRDPHERLVELFLQAVRGALRSPYVTLATDGADRLVHAVLQRLGNYEMGFAEQLLGELGFEPAAAKQRAFLSYALYLGLLGMVRNEPERWPEEAELRALVESAVAMISSRHPT